MGIFNRRPFNEQAIDALKGDIPENRKIFYFDGQKISYNDLQRYLNDLNEYLYASLVNPKYRIVFRKLYSGKIVACLQHKKLFWCYCYSYDKFSFPVPLFLRFWFIQAESESGFNIMKNTIDNYKRHLEMSLDENKRYKEEREALKKIGFRTLTPRG